MAINIALAILAMVCGVLLRWKLMKQNREGARLENEDVELSEKDLKRLQKTADLEGVDVATARRLQKGFRYML